ncbi:hypothetical protein [Pseudomonas taeanensis]|uniref:hypothetical protein n=1 Tax=Pseudomonas taeanensis TaxID=574962 RepID=UPI00128F78B8|nr:hypothetical protein [Pseudomonas taeanensis]
MEFLSDNYLFPFAQLALIALAIYALFHSTREKYSNKTKPVIERSNQSMAKFYAAYGVLTALYLSIALNSEEARYHRVLFSFADTAIIAYLCLINSWFRNKLISWSKSVSNRETDS